METLSMLADIFTAPVAMFSPKWLEREYKKDTVRENASTIKWADKARTTLNESARTLAETEASLKETKADLLLVARMKSTMEGSAYDNDFHDLAQKCHQIEQKQSHLKQITSEQKVATKNLTERTFRENSSECYLTRHEKACRNNMEMQRVAQVSHRLKECALKVRKEAKEMKNKAKVLCKSLKQKVDQLAIVHTSAQGIAAVI